MDRNSRDNIYADMQESVESFAFDKSVAEVFPDMIKRSAPGYVTLVSLIGVIAAKFAKPGTKIYDLGCSLGAVSAAIIANLQVEDCEIVAVDNSEAMIDGCETNLALLDKNIKTSTILADIRDLEIFNASVVTLNYTLQFLPPEDRLKLLEKIFAGLNKDGVVIVSEKICANSAEEQSIIDELHMAFKQANGYSDLEIAQKRTALENVLIPETFDTHKQRLQNSGFSNVYHWFQCLNFHSMLAIKEEVNHATRAV